MDTVLDDTQWQYTIDLAGAPPTLDALLLSDRIVQALTNHGYTLDGGPPDVSIASLDEQGVTLMVNADSDPTAYLTSIASSIPQTSDETARTSRRDQLRAYRDAVQGGATPTQAQTAKAVAALIAALDARDDW